MTTSTMPIFKTAKLTAVEKDSDEMQLIVNDCELSEELVVGGVSVKLFTIDGKSFAVVDSGSTAVIKILLDDK